MLVFWKLLFPEDVYLYEKDLTDPTNNASEIKPHALSTGDKAINYSLGIFFIFPWITSTFLNPLLYQYFRKSSKKASILFKFLAVTDFLTNCWVPLAYSYLMLSPKLFPSATPTMNLARPVWTCLIGCFAQIISFLLAVTRSVKIIFPFFNLKQKYILLYLVGYFLFMAVNNVAYYILDTFYEKNEFWRKILKIALDLCFWANFLHCCAGVFVSIFTVLYLYFATRFD